MSLPTKIRFETISSVLIARRPQDFNTSNHHSYSPYSVVYEDENPICFISQYFYDNYLSDEMKQKISIKVVRLIDKFVVDGIKDLSDDNFLWMYKTFNSMYNFESYYQEISELLPPSCILKLNQQQRQQLLQFDPKNPLNDQIDDELIKKLDKAVKSFNSRKLFVKLSNSSAKNDKPITPFTSTEEIIRFLSTLRETRKRLNDIIDISIILMPFNEKINKDNEFRVFVQETIIKAICPQDWSSVRFFSKSQVTEIIRLIIDLLEKVFKMSKNYHSGVFDVYIHENQAHLIEINPWGSFASSGSSAFHWLKDNLDWFSSGFAVNEYILFRNVDFYNNILLIDLK